jgi:predicted HTH transcriptional regulator
MEEGQEHGDKDQAMLIRKLDPKQRKALELFQEFETITANQIGQLFGFKPRTSAQLCKNWVETGFLKIVDPSNKGRRYCIAKRYKNLISA